MPNNECQFCHMEHTVAVPCVHSNGTSAEELRNELEAALIAMNVAINRVGDAAPNGRDYYLKNGETERVMTQHRERTVRLKHTLAELQQMYDHVQEVINFKAEAKRRDRTPVVEFCECGRKPQECATLDGAERHKDR